MCVCVGGWACVWVSWWVGGSESTCVCTLLLLSIFLVFERFLAPCFIELLTFYY